MYGVRTYASLTCFEGMEVQGGGRAVKFYSGRIICTRTIAFLRIFQGFKILADWYFRRNVRISSLRRAWYNST